MDTRPGIISGAYLVLEKRRRMWLVCDGCKVEEACSGIDVARSAYHVVNHWQVKSIPFRGGKPGSVRIWIVECTKPTY